MEADRAHRVKRFYKASVPLRQYLHIQYEKLL